MRLQLFVLLSVVLYSQAAPIALALAKNSFDDLQQDAKGNSLPSLEKRAIVITTTPPAAPVMGGTPTPQRLVKVAAPPPPASGSGGTNGNINQPQANAKTSTGTGPSSNAGTTTTPPAGRKGFSFKKAPPQSPPSSNAKTTTTTPPAGRKGFSFKKAPPQPPPDPPTLRQRVVQRVTQTAKTSRPGVAVSNAVGEGKIRIQNAVNSLRGTTPEPPPKPSVGTKLKAKVGNTDAARQVADYNAYQAHDVNGAVGKMNKAAKKQVKAQKELDDAQRRFDAKAARLQVMTNDAASRLVAASGQGRVGALGQQRAVEVVQSTHIRGSLGFQKATTNQILNPEGSVGARMLSQLKGTFERVKV